MGGRSAAETRGRGAPAALLRTPHPVPDGAAPGIAGHRWPPPAQCKLTLPAPPAQVWCPLTREFAREYLRPTTTPTQKQLLCVRGEWAVGCGCVDEGAACAALPAPLPLPQCPHMRRPAAVPRLASPRPAHPLSRTHPPTSCLLLNHTHPCLHLTRTHPCFRSYVMNPTKLQACQFLVQSHEQRCGWGRGAARSPGPPGLGVPGQRAGHAGQRRLACTRRWGGLVVARSLRSPSSPALLPTPQRRQGDCVQRQHLCPQGLCHRNAEAIHLRRHRAPGAGRGCWRRWRWQLRRWCWQRWWSGEAVQGAWEALGSSTAGPAQRCSGGVRPRQLPQGVPTTGVRLWCACPLPAGAHSHPARLQAQPAGQHGVPVQGGVRLG